LLFSPVTFSPFIVILITFSPITVLPGAFPQLNKNIVPVKKKLLDFLWGIFQRIFVTKNKLNKNKIRCFAPLCVSFLV
jgi:hypothetical protein